MSNFSKTIFDTTQNPEFPAFILDDIVFGVVAGSRITHSDGYDWIETIDAYEDERLGYSINGISTAAERLLNIVRQAFQQAPGKCLIVNFEDRLKEETRDHRIVSSVDVEIFVKNLKDKLIDQVGVPGIGKDADLGLLLNVYGIIERAENNLAQPKTLIERVIAALPIVKTAKPLPSLDACYEAITSVGILVANEVEQGRVEISSERLSSITETVEKAAKYICNDLDFDFEASRLNKVGERLNSINEATAYSGLRM